MPTFGVNDREGPKFFMITQPIKINQKVAKLEFGRASMRGQAQAWPLVLQKLEKTKRRTSNFFNKKNQEEHGFSTNMGTNSWHRELAPMDVENPCSSRPTRSNV